MLSVKKDTQSRPVQYSLSGVIDETTDFARSLAISESTAHVYCRDINRINSVGIKLWREYLNSLRKKNVTLQFFELSPSMMATVNYLSDFIAKQEIASFCAPYLCEKCGNLDLKIVKIEDAKSFSAKVPNIACSKCKSPSVFDEIPEEYFSFLEN